MPLGVQTVSPENGSRLRQLFHRRYCAFLPEQMVGFRLTPGTASGGSGSLPDHGFLLLALHDKRGLAVFKVHHTQRVYSAGSGHANCNDCFFPGNAGVRIPTAFVAPLRRKEERRKLN